MFMDKYANVTFRSFTVSHAHTQKKRNWDIHDFKLLFNSYSLITQAILIQTYCPEVLYFRSKYPLLAN